MKVKAAICVEPQKPLVIDEIDLEGPKAGECLIRLEATGVCHTDAYTMSGADPEGLFPAVLGHEGGGVVEEVGPDVRGLAVGDHVIPLYIPECRECKFCLSGRTNLCGKIRETQGQGLMPDGTSRLSYKGKMLHHYMAGQRPQHLSRCRLEPVHPIQPLRHRDWPKPPYIWSR